MSKLQELNLFERSVNLNDNLIYPFIKKRIICKFNKNGCNFSEPKNNHISRH